MREDNVFVLSVCVTVWAITFECLDRNLIFDICISSSSTIVSLCHFTYNKRNNRRFLNLSVHVLSIFTNNRLHTVTLGQACTFVPVGQKGSRIGLYMCQV